MKPEFVLHLTRSELAKAAAEVAGRKLRSNEVIELNPTLFRKITEMYIDKIEKGLKDDIEGYLKVKREKVFAQIDKDYTFIGEDKSWESIKSVLDYKVEPNKNYDSSYGLSLSYETLETPEITIDVLSYYKPKLGIEFFEIDKIEYQLKAPGEGLQALGESISIDPLKLDIYPQSSDFGVPFKTLREIDKAMFKSSHELTEGSLILYPKEGRGKLPKSMVVSSQSLKYCHFFKKKMK